MAPRLFMTTAEALQEVGALLDLAEVALRRGEVSVVGDLVSDIRELEDRFGADTVFGAHTDRADRFDAVVAAWKESRSEP